MASPTQDLMRQLEAEPIRPDSARLAVDWRDLPAAVNRAFPSPPADAHTRSMIAKLHFTVASSVPECGATVVLDLDGAHRAEVDVDVFPSPRAAMAALHYHFEWKPGEASPIRLEWVYEPPTEPLGDYGIVLRVWNMLQTSSVRKRALWVFGNALVVVSSEVDVWAGALAIQRFLSAAGFEPPSVSRFRFEPARLQPGERVVATLHSEEPRVASPPRYEGVFGRREIRFSVDDAEQPLPRWLLIAATGDGPIKLLDAEPRVIPEATIEAVGAGTGELRFELADVATLSTTRHTATIEIQLSPAESRARDAFALACAGGEPADLEAAIDTMTCVDRLFFIAANGLDASRLADVVVELARREAWRPLNKLAAIFGQLVLDDRSRQRILAQVLAAAMIDGDDAAHQQILSHAPAEADITWPTLAYNLACSTARSGDRARMLRFVRRALLLWKKPQQFVDDPDFAPYLQDPAFRRLLALDP
jgi:hypothetical protein